MILDKFVQELLDLYSPTGNERVGFISEDMIIEVDNKSNAPEDSFMVSTKDIFKFAISPSTIATWHTHPNKSSNLSGEDYKMFTQWPGHLHIIVGSDGVSVYSYVEEKKSVMRIHKYDR